MADTTITIRAGSELDVELERIAAETGHSKGDVAFDALVEWLADYADGRRAQEILMRNEPTTSLAEMRRKYGLER